MLIGEVCFLAFGLSVKSSGQSQTAGEGQPLPRSNLEEQDTTRRENHAFGSAARREGRSADDHTELGLSRAEAGDYAAVVEHLEAAVKLNPGPLSSCSLGVAYASKAKQDRGRQDEASYKESVGRVIAVFQKAIEQGLETMEVHSNLGIAFQQGGERAAAASSSKRQ